MDLVSLCHHPHLVSDLFAAVIFKQRQWNAPYDKLSLILHNAPKLHRLKEDGDLPPPTVVLRGTLVWQGLRVFKTSLTASYPLGMCSDYIGHLCDSLDLRRKAIESGQPVPHAQPEFDDGLPSTWHALQEKWSEHGVMSSSLDDIYVPDSGFCPKSRDKYEQVTWALQQPHVDTHGYADLNGPLLEALQFEACADAAVLDRHRDEETAAWSTAAESLTWARMEWTAFAPPPLHDLVSELHGPFVDWLIKRYQLTDTALVEDLQTGFKMVGDFLPLGLQAEPDPSAELLLDPDDLWRLRHQTNALLLDSLTPSPNGSVLNEQAMEEYHLGAMTEPVPLAQIDLDQVLLARRFAVEQIKVDEHDKEYLSHRLVDHLTESGHNPATRLNEKLQNDRLDLFLAMVNFMMLTGIDFTLFKEDIKRAFRKLPVFVQHLRLMWVAWMTGSQIWCQGHLASPFGATASVRAWHRFGHMLKCCMLLGPKCPLGRYVDDFFGVVRANLQFSTPGIFQLLTTLIGTRCDPIKALSNVTRIVVLGAEVLLNLLRRTWSHRVCPKKAKRWRRSIAQHVRARRLDAGECSKLAGRLSFACAAAHDRIGRSYARPLHRHARSPLPGGQLSAWTIWSLLWWYDYLDEAAARWKTPRAGPRKRCIAWTDAAGTSRMLAAFLHVDGVWWYTAMRCPDDLFAQLLPREDSAIGLLELLAIILLFGTFTDEIRDSVITVYCDNQGTLHSVIKGASKTGDANAIIGALWMWCARLDSSVDWRRVRSGANIADEPTRDEGDAILHYGAIFRQPRLPAFLRDLWLPHPLLVEQPEADPFGDPIDVFQ